MVFTARSVVPCDFLKAMLESEGIPCVLRNEYGTSLLSQGYPVPGGSALVWAWPEVWIPEEDVERAMPLVESFQRSQQKQSEITENSQPTSAGDVANPSLSVLRAQVTGGSPP